MARRKKTLTHPIIAIALSGIVGMLLISMINSKSSNAIVQEKVKTIIKNAPTIQILTAKDDILIGTKVTAQHFVWRTWPESLLSPDYITKNDKPEILNSLNGGIVRIPIVKGEPIIANKIVSPGERGSMAILLRKGMRAISVPISVISGAGGFILPGDRVDVLYTARVVQQNLFKSEVNANSGTFSVKEPVLKNYLNLNKRRLALSDNKTTASDKNNFREKELLVANDSEFTELMLENVRILAIDQSFGQNQQASGLNIPAILGASATLEVMPEQAKLLAWSVSSGKLTLSLRALDVNDSLNDNSFPITKTSFAWPLEDLLGNEEHTDGGKQFDNQLKVLRSNRVSLINSQKSPINQNNQVRTNVVR